MMTSAESYKYDATFHRIVDTLRSFLREGNFTPGELRQAVILAATMHENENIRPLYGINRWDMMKKPTDTTYGGMDFTKIYVDEASNLFGAPLLFGGTQSGRIQSAKPNFTVQDKQAGLEELMLK